MRDTPIVPEGALAPREPADDGASLRQTLVAAYGGVCAISGCTVVETLAVTLIDPALPLAPGNALVLRADIGLLFGAGLLAIDAVSRTVSLAPSTPSEQS